MKKIYCIEELYPDGKATAINQVELPIKDGWQYEDRWPITTEYEDEDEFKKDLLLKIDSNAVICKVYSKVVPDDYEILMKIA